MNDTPQQPQRNVNAPQSQIGVIGDHARVDQIIFHGPPPSIPLQRPPRAEHFTDREKELAQLLADLQPGRVVTLCGPGGIGKTALAAEAIWTLAPGDKPPERFPDGVIFHSFYGRPEVALALESICRAFGEEPRPTPRDAAQRALAGKRALLLLDGTEEADDLGAVLNVRGNCAVLVTSRTRKDAVAGRQDVQPLEPDGALTLLRAWGKAQATDETACKDICEQVGRLPLAVRLVGRYLDQTDELAAEYLEWLKETPIQALSHGEHREESVDLLLGRSLEQVGRGAREALAVVGLLALAPFGVEPVAQALELATRATKQLLGELVSYGLLRPADRYEVSHALIHTYARERLPSGEETRERLAAYYLALAGGTGDHAVLNAERPHLLAVLADAHRRQDWETTLSFVGAFDDWLDLQGHWTDQVTVLGQVLDAAQGMGDRSQEGVILNRLGWAYHSLGQVEQAIECHTRAFQIAHEIADRRMEGNALGYLGNAYHLLRQPKKAIKYHRETLQIAHDTSDRQMEGDALGNLGLVYAGLGQVEKAIKECYQKALEIAREFRDRRGEGIRLVDLGVAYYSLGQVEQAIEHYQQALAIAREIGDRRMEGSVLANLGNAYRKLGDTTRARQYLSQALVIFEEIKSPDAERVRRLLAELG